MVSQVLYHIMVNMVNNDEIKQSIWLYIIPFGGFHKWYNYGFITMVNGYNYGITIWIIWVILDCLGVSINGDTPKMVGFLREHLIKMDDWGYPYCRKPTYIASRQLI